MPTHDEGAPSADFAAINRNVKDEITDDLISQMASLNDIMRTADSIFTSNNIHLDSKMVSNRWKVEIQFKGRLGKLSYKTIAVVLVEPTATSLADFNTAVASALRTGHVFRVS